jgi:hypothetical protein
MECIPNTAVWGKLMLSVSSATVEVGRIVVGMRRPMSTNSPQFDNFSILKASTYIGVPINDPKTPPFDIVNVPP